MTVDVKNRFEKGDLMQLVTPSGNITFPLTTLLKKDGDAADVAPGSGHIVRIPVPEGARSAANDEYLMLVRYLPRETRHAKSA